MINQITIVGVCGGFGRLFASKLIDSGFAVHGIDLSHHEPADLPLADYLSCDAGAIDWTNRGVDRPGNLILLCLPLNALRATLPRLLPTVDARSLVVDTVSVKTPVVRSYESVASVGQYLSLHPMFAPGEMRGRKFASVVLRDGPEVREFELWLERLGGVVGRVTADEHDRGTAVTQVLTHAALLAFATAHVEAGVEARVIDLLSTPTHDAMLSLAARVAAGDPELYQHIQHDNPHAPAARRLLVEQLLRLADAASQTDRWDRLVLDAIPPRLNERVDSALRMLQAIAPQQQP